MYLAGQIAIDPRTKQVMANALIEDQTRLVLENIKAVLEADGLSMDQIVATTVFLKDLNEFGKIEVARLPRDVKIEISAIAVHP